MAYRNSKKYRKVWEDFYGSIPYGFEIHHIDGNRDNNSLDNLKCVSMQEHYDIHFKQGDSAACHAISLRLNQKPNTGWRHSEESLCKMRKPKQRKEGYKLSDEHKRKIGDAHRGKKRSPRPEEVRQKLRVPKSDAFKKRVSEKMSGVSKNLEQCPHCSKVGGVNVMRRFHFNNCKVVRGDLVHQQKVKCPHCLKEGGISNMKRYHFNNCKQKKIK